MQSSTLTSINNIKQTKPLSGQLKHLLITGNSLCSSNNKAHIICLNQNCTINNPFVCSNNFCQYKKKHKKCAEKRLDIFIQVLEQQENFINKLQNFIRTQIQLLIDQMSQLQDKMIQKIRTIDWLSTRLKLQKYNGIPKYNQNKQKQIKLQINTVQNINSKILGFFWNMNQKIQLQVDISKVEKQVKKLNQQFSKSIKNSFDQIDKCINSIFQTKFQVIQNKIEQEKIVKIDYQQLLYLGKVSWDPTLKGQGQTINNQRVTKTGPSFNDRLTLLSPSIDKIKSSKISWTIICQNIKNWIGVGICLGQVVKKKNFQFQQSKVNADHGCYMISSNGYTWVHKQSKEDNKLQSFQFEQNDYYQRFNSDQKNKIVIQYDKKSGILKFQDLGHKKKNNQKKRIFQMNIDPKNKLKQDQYYICVALGQRNDSIKISNIKTNVGKLYVQNVK